MRPLKLRLENNEHVNAYCYIPMSDHIACWSVLFTDQVKDVILNPAFAPKTMC